MDFYIGCSGFYYPQWKEIFYPKELAPKDWFAFYASRFNTLEINATFYKFPTLKIFENWYRKAPEPFIFSVKVPKIITHIQQFSETKDLIKQLYTIAAGGLKEKLGPLLFQLPPKFAYTAERLDTLLDALDSSFTNVIEFRNESWWQEDVMTKLGERNIVFCGVSYPGLPDQAIINTQSPYYRFHGVPRLFYSPYDEAFIDKKVKEIKQTNAATAFLYFNNTASTAALKNAFYAAHPVPPGGSAQVG